MFDLSLFSLDYFVYIFVSVLAIIIPYILVYKSFKKNELRFIILFIFIYLLAFILNITTFIEKAIIMSLIIHLAFIIAVTIIFREKISYILPIHLTLIPIMIIGDMLIFFIVSAFIPSNQIVFIDNYYLLSIMGIFSLILTSLFFKFTKYGKHVKKHINIFKRISILLLNGFFLILLLRYVSFYNIVNNIYGYVNILLIFLVFLGINVYTTITILELKTESKLKREHNNYITSIQPIIENIKGKQHDFKNHLNVILNLTARENSNANIANYIENLHKDFELSDIHLTIKNPIIGAIVASKYYIALNKNIELAVDLCNDEPPCKDYELTRILTNLLDNAIEATEKICTIRKVITLKSFISSEYYTLEVWNGIAGKESIDLNKIFKKRYSSKKDNSKHGYGLFEVKKIAQKYNGLEEIEFDNDMICIRIKLPL